MAKVCGVLTLLLTSPSIETWLNLLNSEFYFGLWAAVILVSDPSWLRLQRNIGLLLAVLSGPVTTLLAPFFVVRAVVGRTRNEIVPALIVGGGGLFQIAMTVASAMADRKVRPSPFLLGPIVFSKDLATLFFTRILGKANFLFLERIARFSPAAYVLE